MNPGAAVSTRRPYARSAEIGAAAAIAVVAIGLRVLFAPQFDGLDDAGYLEAAQRVSQGRELEGLFPLFRTRVGMAYPLGWLLGAGWLAPGQFWLLTLFAECITIASLLAAGWLLAGTMSAGLWAAGAYAIYPLAVQQSAMYYPTAFQVASIAAAVAFIALATRVAHPRIPAFAAGVSLGIGYLFKEDVAVVVPAIVLSSLLARFPRAWTTLAVCAGAAFVFGLESLVYWRSTGEPLFRLTATSGLGAPVQEALQIAEIWRWDAFLRSLWLLPVQVGVAWWLALPAVWMLWRERRRVPRGLLFVGAALVVVMLYLQFGSGSLSAYTPLPKTPRYTALATPLLMLVLGGWLARQVSAGRRFGMVAAAALVVAAVPCLVYLSISSSERTRNTLAVLPALERIEPANLYTDYYGARILRLLEPRSDVRVWYHAKFETNEIVISADPRGADGAYVLLDRQAAKVYTSSYELQLPPQIDQPPPTWTLVWRHRAYGDGTLTRALLEGARDASAWLPGDHPLGRRIQRSISDMIDGDEAMLFRVAH